MKFKTYEEEQKQLSEHKYYYSINEYFDDGNGVFRDEKCVDEKCVDEKLTDEEIKEWFSAVAKKVRSENTEEERQTHKPFHSYLELGYSSIKYDEDRDEYFADIEDDWFGEIGEEIEGEIYKKKEEEDEEEEDENEN